MSHSIHLKVMNPEKTLLNISKVSYLRLPLADGGLIGILPCHAPLIAQTAAGSMFYSDDAGDHEIQLQPGILSIDMDEVTILTRGQRLIPASQIQPKSVSYDRLIESLSAELGREWNADAETT